MSFESSIKTTTYRKLYEIASLIETEGIVEVFYVGEMYNYPNSEQLINLESRERIPYMQSESLVFFRSAQDVLVKSYSFDSAKVDDMEYIASVLIAEANKVSNLVFMSPIINEFQRLKGAK